MAVFIFINYSFPRVQRPQKYSSNFESLKIDIPDTLLQSQYTQFSQPMQQHHQSSYQDHQHNQNHTAGSYVSDQHYGTSSQSAVHNNQMPLHSPNSQYIIEASGPTVFSQHGVNNNANQPTAESFDSQQNPIRNPTSAPFSNVQIVCRINAPQKTIASSSTHTANKSKRSASTRAAAAHISFTSAGLSSATKAMGSLRQLHQKMNPPSKQLYMAKGSDHSHHLSRSKNTTEQHNASSRSFMSVQSTPAQVRSSSWDTRDRGLFMPLRHKIKETKGVRFPTGGISGSGGHQNNNTSLSPSGGSTCHRRRGCSARSNSNQGALQRHNSSSHQAGKYPQTSTLKSNHLLHNEAKYSVFTTGERTDKIVVSESAVAGKVINNELAYKADIAPFTRNLSKKGLASQVFEFDQVFNETQKQDKFYSQCVKPLVTSFVEGENATVAFFGPSQSGKTFSLQGKAGKDRGVVPRAVEDILQIVKNSHENSTMIEDFGTDTTPILSLNQGAPKFGKVRSISPQSLAISDQAGIQIYPNQQPQAPLTSRDSIDGLSDRLFLKISVYMIYCDRMYDLLSQKSGKRVKMECYIDPKSQQVVSRFANMSERLIFSTEHYYAVTQEAFKERKSISMKLTDHEIRKRSHLVISLTLMNQTVTGPVKEVSKLNFVELCGSEQSVSDQGQVRDTSVRQFVTKSFNGLSTQILKAALGKRSSHEEGDISLVSTIKSTLTSHSNILLVACASPSPQFFDHALPAVKFCSRIRETIVRKLNKLNQGVSQNSQANNMNSKEKSSLSNAKQTRFNLDVAATNPDSTFGRQNHLQTESDAITGSALRKRNSYSQLHTSRSRSPRENSPINDALNNVQPLATALEGEIKMYDSLVREVIDCGNPDAVSLDEVREWSMRAIESINRAVFDLSKARVLRGSSERQNTEESQRRVNTLDHLYYLKQRIGEIEHKAMTAAPFKSISPSYKQAQRSRSGSPQGLQDSPQDRFGMSSRLSAGGQDPVQNFKTASNTPFDKAPILEANPKAYRSQYARELSEQMKGQRKEQKVGSVQTANEEVPKSARVHSRQNSSSKNQKQTSLRNWSRSSSRRGSTSQSPMPIDRPGFTSSKRSNGRVSRQNSINQNSSRQQTESYRSQGCRQPRLTKAKDIPDLQHLKEKFISSGRVQDIVRSTFGVSEAPKALYQSAEETLADIQRLIMLEDFEGLRKRVVQLYKERQGCDELLVTRGIEVEELRDQLDARDSALQEVERANETNLDEYLRAMQTVNGEREKLEAHSTMQIKHLQESIEAQTAELENLKRARQTEEQTHIQMTQENEMCRQARQESELRAARLQEENDKLLGNYEVLKEHEVNIIKDFSEKKSEAEKHLEFQVMDLRRQIDHKTDILNETSRQTQQLEEQLRKVNLEARKLEDARALQDEATNVVSDKLNQERSEKKKLELKLMELEENFESQKNFTKVEENEKKLANEEIKQLQELIEEMEQTVQRLTHEIGCQKKETCDRDSQIKKLQKEALFLEERLVQRNKDLEAANEKEFELQEAISKLNNEYEQLDRAHIKLRAQEYDKVDFLKVNAELEGRNKSLQMDIENLIKERNELRNKVSEKDIEADKLRAQTGSVEVELEYLKRSNDMQMEKFDSKFSDFQRELTDLTDQNLLLKEREKRLKRQVNELEVQNLEWREKCKYLQQHNEGMKKQFSTGEKELHKRAYESNKETQLQMKEQEQDLKREEATDRAFVDIKGMISEFKRQRESSRDAHYSPHDTQRLISKQTTEQDRGHIYELERSRGNYTAATVSNRRQEASPRIQRETANEENAYGHRHTTHNERPRNLSGSNRGVSWGAPLENKSVEKDIQERL